HLGKLNDGKKLNKNASIGNDTGIDGFWRADPKNNCGKKYAIIEVKATTGVARVTNKYVASKLGVLSEKHKGKPVIQMDHYWIGTRIKKMFKNLPKEVTKTFKNIKNPEHFSKFYSRHIIVVSLLVEPGLSHIDALLDDKKSDAADPDHAIHNGIVVHKYGESTIDNIIQEKHRRLKNKANKKKPN
ncbi:hypothetical protein, partial [Snodgrassella alvi]|uniref:hypothetical protein n=1 Tax=Snodgrassella alvi TaxID=1196083 RepID=UPI001C556CD3